MSLMDGLLPPPGAPGAPGLPGGPGGPPVPAPDTPKQRVIASHTSLHKTEGKQTGR